MLSSTPAIAGGIIYVGAGDGNLYALNATSGLILWQYSTGSFIRGQTAIANGALYVGTGKGVIYALGTPQQIPQVMPTQPTASPSPASTATPTFSPSSTNTATATPTPTPKPTSNPTEQPTQTAAPAAEPTKTPLQPTSNSGQQPAPSTPTTLIVAGGIGGLAFAVAGVGYVRYSHRKINAAKEELNKKQ